MTPRRIASQQRTQVPHSAPGDSRKDALWGCHSHEKAHFACGPHKGRTLHASGGCAESPSSPICVHPCVPTSARSGATVYTNAPKRRREAIFADLCTLLHTHGRPQRRNSVHKCPETAPRGRFRRSVYTPAYPRPLAAAGRGARRVPTTARLPFRESLLRPHQAQSVLSQWVSLSCG